VIAGGTLIILIPTSSGLVIAADSRITIFPNDGSGLLYCDNIFKIAEIQGRERTALFLTGYSTVWDFSNVPLGEVCRYVGQGNGKFDAGGIAKRFLEHSPADIDAVGSLPDGLSEATRQFIQSNPDDYAARRGLQLFQVGIASYDFDLKKSQIRSFSVDMDSAGAVSHSAYKVEEFEPDDACRLVTFGEVTYLIENVFNGPGIQFLGERYGRFRNSMTIIQATDAVLAADFATDIIEAAEKTTSIVGVETAIGGPVDVLLLGEHPKPHRMRWKDVRR
jgi:hypothetical protein